MRIKWSAQAIDAALKSMYNTNKREQAFVYALAKYGKEGIRMNKMTVSNVKHLKGNALEGYTASVQCGSKSVNVAYDCNNNNLVIHRWYRLSDDERNAVRSFAIAHFLGLMSGEATA